jgi:tricorn protease
MRTRLLAWAALLPAALSAQTPSIGYYRFPALGDQSIVFTAEGDLWRVPVTGGIAQRLTSHPGEESHAAISPDGKTVAFSASYEGPTEVYTMPIDGGAPVRRTFEGGNAITVGWTPDGKVMYSTNHFATLPNDQLAEVDLSNNATTLVELAQASDGAYSNDGTLFFTRLPFQGSYTKRYQGGTAQNIWKFGRNASSAVPITANYAGTSRSPMIWNGRVYFASDRDGTMNLWSMNESGGDLRQHTRHVGFDVQSTSLRNGRIAYQLGADIHVFDVSANRDAVVDIRLVSDFEQTREKWLTNPSEWITDVHMAPTGDRVVLTARGQVFVVPVKQGRLAEISRDAPVRYRQAKFFPDGKTLLTLSDRSGEVEFWRVPSDGLGEGTQLTNDAKVLRWDGTPSPDGRYIAHTDKDQRFWLYDTQSKKQTLLGANKDGDFSDVSWSPDGRWMAYVTAAPNSFGRVFLYDVEHSKATPITSDRYDSYSPAWTPDGKWLYLLSDRRFQSSVDSPWGPRQPEPFFDRQTLVYAVPLTRGLRSPFQPDDELSNKSAPRDSARAGVDTSRVTAAGGVTPSIRVAVDLDGIERRLIEAPVSAGNYGSLTTDGKRLYFTAVENRPGAQRELKSFSIDNKGDSATTVMPGIRGYELSADGKKILVVRGTDLFVIDAGPKAPDDLSKAQINLRNWTMHLLPRDEWRQMFVDAWRLERDYFYDRGMNGVDWNAIRQRYAPIVERVTDRSELSDLLGQMVGELSALHIFVVGGDMRRGSDNVMPASLGAVLTRDAARGGYRIDHVYKTDPDAPRALAPLAAYGVDVAEGDVITSVNGVPTISVPDMGSLLRGQANRQVILSVVSKTGGTPRQVIVTPVSQGADNELRYSEWEYTRRLAVEQQAAGQIGYVHLRAMSTQDIAQWTRDFYPVFDRAGLIIDVRHNGGGNIDSWILEKLMRKAWFYFQPRIGSPSWNMQYAFRGHVVVLTDEFTGSDGEAFSEGFRRLGLGKLIGTRTWGGEIWLSFSNRLVDRGIASAAEIGVYGPEGKWLIEGHGVDPDIVVDNEPHASFLGKDAQLDAAIAYLQREIKEKPVVVPAAPDYPKKAFVPVQAGSPKPPEEPRR